MSEVQTCVKVCDLDWLAEESITKDTVLTKSKEYFNSTMSMASAIVAF